MSDEHDSWFKDAFGFDVGGAVQSIKDEAAAAAAQVQSTVTQVVDDVRGAVDGAIDAAVGAVTGVAKKAAGAAGLGGGGPGAAGGGDAGGSGSFPLRGSVGRGGQNQPNDVRAVQAALGIAVDGQCGGGTIAAIEAFQRNQGLPKADGRVDPGGATERALSGGGGGAARGGGASSRPSATNDLGGASSSPGQPAIAEDDIPRVEGETVLDQVEVDGEPGGDAPTGPAATVTIAVRAHGDGSFTITGSGFPQLLVSVRAVDDFLGERWFPTQAPDGKLAFKTPPICVAAGAIHFSVFAGTHPLVGDPLSTIAHSSCEGPAKPENGKKDDKDDKDGEPEQPEDDEETFEAALRTSHQETVRYFVQDRKTGKLVVNGERHAGGETITFRCAFVSPDTGEVFYWRDEGEGGRGQTAPTRTFVSPGEVTDMLH